MSSAKSIKDYLRPHRSKIIAILLVICAGLIVSAKSTPPAPYALADQFPRGPALYAQFHDLPALVKQWNDSNLKKQFLASANFQQFAHRHLAIKIAARWQEFNKALGFDLDADLINSSVDNRAAVALYDIGRLDFIFIIPLSEEKIAASKFFQQKDHFEETELADGIIYYSIDVDADRGRQKQKIDFALQNGLLVVATNEQIFLRALSNITGKARQDRLSEDPNFKQLSSQMSPHFATIWVDQTKLNNDWYFRHYWAMRNIDKLADIRAGIFDLELQAGRWIEHRDLLTNGKAVAQTLSAQDARRIAALIPVDLPYWRLTAIDSADEAIANQVRNTLFDPAPDNAKKRRSGREQYYNDADFENDDNNSYDEESYFYLSRDYNLTIDNPRDAGVVTGNEIDESELRERAQKNFNAQLQQALAPAAPRLTACAQSIHSIAGPLFAESRRAMIISLRAPGSLNRALLERAIGELAGNQLMLIGANSQLKWSDSDGGKFRELALPLLSLKICYGVKGEELIIANSSEMLQSILNDKNADHRVEINSANLSDLTIVRFDQRAAAFDQIFDRLDAEQIAAYWQAHSGDNSSNGHSEEFFSGNIASLLSTASAMSEIEIVREARPGRLHEEITLFLNQPAAKN